LKILVTGSAGYIGSHACLKLLEDGHHVVGVDNYSRGNLSTTVVLERFDEFTFFQVDVRNQDKLFNILTDHGIEAVMHFAAFAYVGESCHMPLLYYSNNVCGSLSLLTAMGEAGVTKLVFSSTCATYGEPSMKQSPISESCVQNPINPYGRSKLMVEQVIRDFANSNQSPDGFGFVILRYFNIAGADPQGRIGEDHRPETHLIPLCLQVALGQREEICIFGTDYPTQDGTCIRDYVHVLDLIDAHLRCLDSLGSGDRKVYNVGTGSGHSVREIIESCKKITGIDIDTYEVTRRVGDPPVLYADNSYIQQDLGFKPCYRNLDSIISDAWHWFKLHPGRKE